MIIMNMQNKLYTIQFFSPPNVQFSPKKGQTPSWTREDSYSGNKRKKKITFSPLANPHS